MTKNVLCSAETVVTMESLPRCLRHSSPASALEDAKYLTEFMQDAISSMMTNGGCPTVGESMGVVSVFELIRDKLEIASGRYKFPLCDYGKDVLLCERIED